MNEWRKGLFESVGEVVKGVLEGQVVVHSTAEKQTAGPLLLTHQHTAASVAQRRMCELMYISVNHLCGNTETSCS